MTKKYGHIRFKHRIFIYLLVTMTIPVIALGAFSFKTYTESVTNEVHSSVEASLNQFKLRMDTTINYIKKYYIETTASYEVAWLLKKDIQNKDYSMLVDAQNLLSCSDYLSQYISGYTFVNYSTEKVLSNRGMYEYGLVTNQDAVREYIGIGSGMANNTSFEGGTSLRRETIDLSGILFYQNLPLSQKDKHGLMFINIDVAKMNEAILNSKDNSDIVIYDKEGQLVYTTDKTIASALEGRLGLLKETDFLNITIDKKTSYMVSTASSDVVDWTYVVAWNLDEAQTGAGYILAMTIAILCGGLLSLGLIWLFADRIYRPVNTLLHYTSDAVSGYSDKDESEVVLHGQTKDDAFMTISGNVDKLVDRNTALRVQLEAQRAQLSEFFLTRLIEGNLKPEQIDFYLNKLAIGLGRYYAVLTLGLQNNMVDQYNEARQDALRLEVNEHIPDEIKKLFLMEPACNAKVITIVAAEDELKALDRKILEIYKGLDIFVRVTYNFSVKVGVSSPYTDLNAFKKAHNEAIEALKNNAMTYENNESADFEGVTYYSDIQAEEKASYNYDRFMEKEIKDAVDDGNEKEAEKLTMAYIDQLLSQPIADIERQFYLQKLMNEIMTVPIDAGVSVDVVYDKDANNLFKTMNQIYDTEKLKQYFVYNVIAPIIDYLKEHRASKYSQIIRDIVDLIEERNGDVTLAECADALGYHSTYIWKVMKAERNITYSDYIAGYKLETAKKMLLETDHTINEIANIQGYTNAQNFIRFFNKHLGMTPGKYRSKHRLKS